MSSSRLPSARRPAGTGGKSRPMSMFEAPTDHLKRLQHLGGDGSNSSNDGSLLPQSGTTSKQAKRRSLLPTFSRTASVEEEKEMISAIREDTSDSEVSSRPGTQDERKTMLPPPKPARPTSMRMPGSGVSTRSMISHIRTTSKDSSGSSAKPPTPNILPPNSDSSVRKRAGSIRLPAALGQQTIPTRGSSTRAITSATIAQKRSSVIVSKAPVLDTSAASEGSNQTSPTSPTGSTTSRQSVTLGGNAIPKKQLPPPSRPTFSTHQQHYSPAKSSLPKPPVPTAKSSKRAIPSSPDVDVPVSLEVSLEQIELLQLSILHQAAGQTLREYEESAKSKLSRHHAKLKKDFDSLCPREQEQRRMRNLRSLEMWCSDAALLAEHLQTLSRVVSDLRGHTEPGSRYSDLTETFDQWLSKAEPMLLGDNQAATFAESLPESWRATHTSLSLKLRSIQRDISTMPPALPDSDTEFPSSLEIILDSCSELVESMLKELELMTKLHKEVLKQGKTRIDEQVNAVIAASDRSADKESWVPAWQAVT